MNCTSYDQMDFFNNLTPKCVSNISLYHLQIMFRLRPLTMLFSAIAMLYRPACVNRCVFGADNLQGAVDLKWWEFYFLFSATWMSTYAMLACLMRVLLELGCRFLAVKELGTKWAQYTLSHLHILLAFSICFLGHHFNQHFCICSAFVIFEVKIWAG